MTPPDPGSFCRRWEKRRAHRGMLPVQDLHPGLPHGLQDGYHAAIRCRACFSWAAGRGAAERRHLECVSCEACYTRCPNGVNIPLLMDTMRRSALAGKKAIEGDESGIQPHISRRPQEERRTLRTGTHDQAEAGHPGFFQRQHNGNPHDAQGQAQLPSA